MTILPPMPTPRDRATTVLPGGRRGSRIAIALLSLFSAAVLAAVPAATASAASKRHHRRAHQQRTACGAALSALEVAIARRRAHLTPDELASDFGRYTEENFFDDMARVTQNRTDPDLCEILVRQSNAALHWMRRQGVRFLPQFGRQSFKVGDSHVVKVNLKTDLARFYINGSLARKIPVSGGMGGYDSFGNDFYTTSGVHLTMGSYDSVWMTSPNIQPGQPGYYHEIVYDDVQISDSGEYMHQSPGGLWCLGVENCSHGCVRMTADGAAWWRHPAYRGDPVTITGPPRPLAWDNGWGYWQESWSAWLKGSSAGPVTTIPWVASPAETAPAGHSSPAERIPAAIPTTAG